MPSQIGIGSALALHEFMVARFCACGRGEPMAIPMVHIWGDLNWLRSRWLDGPVPSFETAPADLRFAYAVAAFADVLRGAEDAPKWSFETIAHDARDGEPGPRSDRTRRADRARRAAARHAARSRLVIDGRRPGPITPWVDVSTFGYARLMALNIKNTTVERLADEVARLAGETKTEAIRRALEERRARLAPRSGAGRATRIREFLKSEVWPLVPRGRRGRRLTKRQEEAILGFGSDGI